VPYGVSFAAAAATASSPSEFLGVMRGGSVVFGCLVGFGSSPGTGLRRSGMAEFEDEITVFPDIRYRALGDGIFRCTFQSNILRFINQSLC
jgi:hypothetical protein